MKHEYSVVYQTVEDGWIMARVPILSDTREAPGQESEAYAFLNDQEQSIGGDVTEALKAYEVTPVPWSQRDQYVQALEG